MSKNGEGHLHLIVEPEEEEGRVGEFVLPQELVCSLCKFFCHNNSRLFISPSKCLFALEVLSHKQL
jgi:hypothetical protein